MVEDAPIVVDGSVSIHDIRLVARMRSPFYMHKDSGDVSEMSSSGESELWLISGMGPAVQISFL